MLTDDKYKINLSTWKRKDHYAFFGQFEQPFWGITTEINCTSAYNYCKMAGVNFFLYYLHKSLYAANSVQQFRQRIERDGPVEYSSISGSVTVSRTDQTFGFAYFDYHSEFKEFAAEAGEALRQEKMNSGLRPAPALDSIIHYSVLTGIRFTSVQHAQRLGVVDSVPKIVFGKLSEVNGRVLLPISVHVHHGLVDGLHVDQFIQLFQEKMEVK